MSMTHYMELLATNQPWNLIAFMAIPVILIETLTAVEFFVVFNRSTRGALKGISRLLGIITGLYFTGVFLYMITSVVPTIQWRGLVDIIAVWSYLAGVLPLASIALLDSGLIARGMREEEKLKLHFILVIVFLVLAHIAMIFGMLDPSLFQSHMDPMMHQNMKM